MSNPPRFHDSDHPLFQTTDTFQQLIQDLNHFGDNVDSDMKYLDSAIGPETDGFRLTKLKGLEDLAANTLVDAINELDSDLHGVGGGNFKADTNTEYKTVTDAINEVERVFDASAGEILYPTGDATETQTRLLISTNQSGGQRIDMKSGHDIILDAVNDVVVDAGGGNITFKDDSVTRFDFALGGTNNVTVTGNYYLNVDGTITLDAEANIITYKNGTGGDQVTHTLADNATYTINYPSDVIHTQTAGDLTFTVPGDDVIFNGNGGEAFRINLDAAPNLTLTGTSASVTNTAGDFTVNAFASYVLNTNNATYTWTFDSDRISHTGNLDLDISGDIVLDAGGSNITYQVDGVDRIAYTLGATNTATVTGNYIVDVSGDITLDADGGNWYFKDNGSNQFHFSATDGTLYRYGGNLTLDAPVGDIILDAEDNSIIFKNGSGGDQVEHLLADNGDLSVIYPNNISHTNTTGHLTFDIAGEIRLDADDGVILFKDNAVTKFTFNMDGTPEIDVVDGLVLDVEGDITLDANGADIFFKDNGSQFGRLRNNAGQVRFYSGTNEVFRGDSADMNVRRAIQLPASGSGTPLTTAKTLHGALADINSRIPNIYDRNGTLLNPLP